MPVDGRLVRGDATRRTVLKRAADVASVEGLDGLSIGRLAAELELSKSGVFALFGSKEELQLAAVRFAGEVFAASVVGPTSEVEPGIGRLRALCENWLDYSRRRIFPGGCFFFNVGAEFDARPGKVHDAVADASRGFAAFITGCVQEAKDLGELQADVSRLAFELHALGRAANADAVMFGGTEPYDVARACMLDLLTAAAA
ncbi:TetR/AcrR family transcriptional regulator [Amycolatopsis sp. H20-H5]|uniref:TetR/AcrR family transcriptional regulator n=1 Tax=Amycolatopsis sp. H20-H5 TaxID=3046309 RepID=UPI002DB9D57B|nr:TetR/AcrR family transcriptional regulator [Amycolatopsis sp. H20-H5]MEC3982320.1 TetR/AcrR family transcriptional regulator [Amycolatopsis sp. H20-H5]